MTLPRACKYECDENPTENCFNAEDKADTYVCNICEKKFSTKSSLTVHINSHNFTDKDLVDKTEVQNVCNICLKKFTAKKNLLKHLRDVHKNYSEAERMVVKKIKCPERNCQFLCRMMKELRNHIEKCHKIKILKDTLQFPSEIVFQKWKKEEESNTVSWFVTGRKKTTLTNGTKKQTLYCHRTGHYNPKGFGKYRMRSVGSCKIGVTCPAAMEITESAEGELNVIYYKTHLGHMQDVVYLKLTAEEKAHLAEKIKQGFSFDAILEDVKESRNINNEKKKRIHLLSKKDLYSIMYRNANNSNRKSTSKESIEQINNKEVLKNEGEVHYDNVLSIEQAEKFEKNFHQNFTFYSSHSSAVSLQSQPNIQDNSNFMPQQKYHRDLNIPQVSEGVASQIVILSPNIDYSSVAEIILLSAGDGILSQPEEFSQTIIEASEHQEVCNSESHKPVSSEILMEHTRVSKSNLHQQLKEKFHKISEYLPQSEHLTPKQFDLINAKLDGILDIFNVAIKKAKTRKPNSRKKEFGKNKVLTTLRTSDHESEEKIHENYSEKFYESPLIYAVYN